MGSAEQCLQSLSPVETPAQPLRVVQGMLLISKVASSEEQRGEALSIPSCTTAHNWFLFLPSQERLVTHGSAPTCVRDRLRDQHLQVELPLPFYGSFYGRGHQMPHTETFMPGEAGTGAEAKGLLQLGSSFGNTLPKWGNAVGAADMWEQRVTFAATNFTCGLRVK